MAKNIYKNNQKWSPRRWAWEFLKRNPEYIELCDQARNLTDDAKAAAEFAIAKKFQLKKFKDYTESYSPKNPIFLSTSIYKWKGGSEKRKPDKTTIRVKILPGQVVIRFQVDATLNNSRAIKVQLESAKIHLERYRDDLIDSAKKESPQPEDSKKKTDRFNPQPAVFLRRLKIIDAKRRGLTRNEIYKKVFPDKFKELDGDKDALHDHFKTEIPEATKMLDKYLEIAAMGFDPKKKST